MARANNWIKCTQNLHLYVSVNITQDLLHEMKQTMDKHVAIVKKLIAMNAAKIASLEKTLEDAKYYEHLSWRIDNVIMKIYLSFF